jgi:hypothetical protein
MVSKEFLEPAMDRIGYGHLAMPLGLVGAVGSNVMSGFRNAGMAKVADLVKQGLLNPDLAKTYVMNASKMANRGSEVSLSHQLKRLSVLAPLAQPQDGGAPATQGYAGGGSVGGGGSWGGGGPFFMGPLTGGGGHKAPFASGGSVTVLPSYAYGPRRAGG